MFLFHKNRHNKKTYYNIQAALLLDTQLKKPLEKGGLMTSFALADEVS